MTRPPQPGTSFWLATDLGFAVGLCTHYREKIGHLVWIADPVFEEAPTLDDVQRIDRWRWPVFFPLRAALRRGIVTEIGEVPVPERLKQFPVFRSGAKGIGWNAFTVRDGVEVRLGPTQDRQLPIYSVVNDTRLKNMIVGGWTPAQRW